MPGRRNSFYQHVDPPDAGQLCAELSAALGALQQIEAVRIVAMGYANRKMPEFVAIIDHEPSSAAIAAARSACSRYLHVNFVAGGIGCREHWSEICWEDHLPGQAKPTRGSLLNSIRRAFRRA
jgi:hypothetical protein